MDNKTVVVDVDGVLANFERAFCEVFGDDRRELESLEARYPNRILPIRNFVSDLNTYKNLVSIELGLTVVDYLVEQGFDVHIISARPHDTTWVTRDWLKRYDIHYSYFGTHPNKIAYIGQLQPLVAIDDLISVARGLKRYNVPVLLMQHPWNWFYEDKTAVFSNINQFMTQFQKLITQ